MAIVGMTLGVIAVVCAIIPLQITWFIAFACFAVGMPLSGVALYHMKKQGQRIGMPVTGMALNSVAVVIIIAIWAYMVSYYRDYNVIDTDAQSLYNAREVNPDRFDQGTQGDRVRITGRVVKVDDGKVTLGIDLSDRIHTYNTVGVDLQGFSKEEQASINKGQSIRAICEIWMFDSGTLIMKECRLD